MYRTAAAVGPALDLVDAEIAPRAVSLLDVGRDGIVEFAGARAPKLNGDAGREVRNWHRQVSGRSPLTAAALVEMHRPVVTFADIEGSQELLRDDAVLRSGYRRIGAIDDTRILIRDGGRLAATIAVWRPLQSAPWSAAERRRLEALQPLIEVAWSVPGGAPPTPSALVGPLAADLTPRQREVAELLAVGATNSEVARALGISSNTVKSHVRAALAKLGAGSRHELTLALRRA